MGRRGATGLIAGLLALLASPAPALEQRAAPTSEFYGVVSQSRLDRSDFERMAAGDVGTLRVALSWSQIDRTAVPGDYEWSELDFVVAQGARHGIRVLPTVYTVPGWVSSLEGCERGEAACQITPPHTEVGLAAWRNFLADAVRRYGEDGIFWALHPELPATPIEAWQIWNEMNSPGFFAPKPDADRYAGLLSAAADAIRERDPGAEIILGGMFRYPLGGANGGLRATEFLRRLYAEPGIEADFDGIAVHPYAGRVSGVRRQVRRLVGVVREQGDAGASTWITEVGWSSGGKKTPLNRGLEGQAQRLRKAFRWLTAERERLRIRSVLWYAWRDVPEAQSRCKWCARSGLFPVASLERPKPAWRSFLRFTGGR